MLDSIPNIPIQKLNHSTLTNNNVELSIKREDLIHPEISGNKWRKLKFNISHCIENNFDAILTFGGAYSNHIRATAAAGKMFKIPTIGIIRGEELGVNNPTLVAAQKDGMQLVFVSREEYKLKEKGNTVQKLQAAKPKTFIVPEGGANTLAIKGCNEILQEVNEFDICFSAVGTGGTLAGLINGGRYFEEIIGIPVLKGAQFLETDIKQWLNPLSGVQWSLEYNYHFGGYAKFTPELISFIRWFYEEFEIKLDPIYTGKMMFAIWDLISKKHFQNKTILALHTGGLQGIGGFEDRYKTRLF